MMLQILGFVFFRVFPFIFDIYFFVINGLGNMAVGNNSEMLGLLTLGIQSKKDVYKYLDRSSAGKAFLALKARNWSLGVFLWFLLLV